MDKAIITSNNRHECRWHKRMHNLIIINNILCAIVYISPVEDVKTITSSAVSQPTRRPKWTEYEGNVPTFPH